MSVNLVKGQKISLTKEQPGLSKVIVGLGWDEAKGNSKSIDCDAFALLLTNGQATEKKDCVYYGNLNHVSGSVKHQGDNLTGAGEGDDEQIVIDLKNVPAQYERIVLAVNIYQAKVKGQHFGMIENAFIRLVDSMSGRELCRYNLSENYYGKTVVLFGEIYRHNGEWKFSAIGQGSEEDCIADFAKRYGGTWSQTNYASQSSNTNSSSGGCYVATAVYGSYDCPQVWTLRRYRDNILATSWYGRAFIHIYYAISPTFVRYFGNQNWFKKLFRTHLDRMVSDLNGRGVADSPYEDRNW